MGNLLKYGYCFLFEHEPENKSVVLNEQILNPEINLVKPELERELLNPIREEDPNLIELRLKAIQYNYCTADVNMDYCPAPVDTFLGRYEELQTLKTLFTQHQVVALVGMGGLGKTQLSRKYVQVNKADYQYKYWLESETPEKLENSFKKLAKKLHIETDNINDEAINDVYRKIQAVPTILVFDNVENPADVYAYLPTRVDLLPGVTIHVLVTSRWTDWSCDNQIECYKLQPFNISESLKIFEEYFGKSCIETLQTEWEELAQMLGYLPLTLQVTASAIRKLYEHNCNLGTVLDDYMKQLRKEADGLLNDPLTEYGNRSIYASMLLALKQFENKTDDEWKLAVTLINVAAYMDPDGIKKERLLKLLDTDENPWILDEALVLLTNYSLFDQVVDIGEKYYTAHRIMQTSIRHYHIENGTADMYYAMALKCELANDYRPRHPHSALVDLLPMTVLLYANERATAVVAHYKENLSSTLFIYLVECKAITAVQAVFERMTTNQIQSVIQQQDLLYYAVWSQDLSMVQLLYSNGADINQVHSELGIPPLHLALQLKNMEIPKWLLENGAAPALRDRAGRTALHVALMLGNCTLVSDLIKKDKAVVHAIDNRGNTPLLSISYSFNDEDILSTIRVLLANGADITAVNKVGDTVLHSAAGKACVPAVSFILEENKGLINIVNKNGKTALHKVCDGYAIKAKSYDTGIDQRICSTIRVLLENGADLTKVDSQGNTALHSAACYACPAAVSLYLQLDKDLINVVNENGKTALHEVCGSEFDGDENIVSTIRVLVESGVDLTKVDIKGNTVLHLAARRANAAAVSLLLQLKKDLINIVNEDGQTALHVILYDITYFYVKDESILQTIRALVESGVDLMKVDTRGNTVLHLAVRGARAAAVSLLLQLKKDLINIVNEDGQTALHVLGNGIIFPFEYKSEQERKELLERAKEIIQVLIMNGLCLDIRDNTGCTPLDTVKPEYKNILLQVAAEIIIS